MSRTETVMPTSSSFTDWRAVRVTTGVSDSPQPKMKYESLTKREQFCPKTLLHDPLGIKGYFCIHGFLWTSICGLLRQNVKENPWCYVACIIRLMVVGSLGNIYLHNLAYLQLPIHKSSRQIEVPTRSHEKTNWQFRINLYDLIHNKKKIWWKIKQNKAWRATLKPIPQ